MNRRLTFLAVFVCLLAFAASALPQEKPSEEQIALFREIYDEATELYEQEQWEAAAKEYLRSLELIADSSAAYNAACCFALNGDKENAVKWLEQSILLGFEDRGHVEEDPDFNSIRDDKRFADVLALIRDVENSIREKLTLGERKAVFWITAPKGYDKTKKYPVLLVLPHGAGSAKDVNDGLAKYYAAEASARGYLVVSVQHQGLQIAAGPKQIVDAILKKVADDYSGDTSKVILAGASSGGVLGFFLLAEMPQTFKAFIGIPAFVPDTFPEEAIAGLRKLPAKFPMLFMAGSDDEYWERVKGTADALAQNFNMAVTFETLNDQGHELTLDGKVLFDWMDQALADKAPENK